MSLTDYDGLSITKVLGSLALGACVIRMMTPPTSIAESTGDSKVVTKDTLSTFLTSERGIRSSLVACWLGLPLLSLRYAVYHDAARAPWEVVELAALVLGVLGIWLRVSAFRALARFFTFKLTIQDDHQLVDTGPYRYLCHPSYTGCMMIVPSYMIYHHYPLALIALSGAVGLAILAFRVTEEEVVLEKHFGAKWIRFRESRWRLIPGLW
ncbi:hypothetical protein HKX48_002596 [Thoreauomyces humboldtii]|nr:hypothetical protein HKX48_002596 [Thoreauomyces humboldtii]